MAVNTMIRSDTNNLMGLHAGGDSGISRRIRPWRRGSKGNSRAVRAPGVVSGPRLQVDVLLAVQVNMTNTPVRRNVMLRELKVPLEVASALGFVPSVCLRHLLGISTLRAWMREWVRYLFGGIRTCALSWWGKKPGWHPRCSGGCRSRQWSRVRGRRPDGGQQLSELVCR
jgi:hypothetical protein